MPPRMRVSEFMAQIESETLAALPKALRDTCTHRVRFVWLQVHFHSPKVHYEVCLTRKTERIEIGLHFEGPHDFSYRWAELIAPYMPEIQAQLGPQMELEEWTASWARLHETIPYDPPSPALASEIAGRLSRIITVCQPIIERERANISPELEAEEPKKGRPGRFSRRRRARA
ncbi:MAG TPA: hypothetical protein VIT93_06195 [Dehalococcoidia bacterium]